MRSEFDRPPGAAVSLFFLRRGGGGFVLPGLVLAATAACLGTTALALGGLGAPRRSSVGCRIPSGGGAVLALLGLLLKHPGNEARTCQGVRRGEARRGDSGEGRDWMPDGTSWNGGKCCLESG